jgi:hypothetical protein
MKKIWTRLSVIAAATMFLAACGLITIPVSLPIGEWIADSGDTVEATTGPSGTVDTAAKSIDVGSEGAEAFARGGVGFSGMSIDGGTVSDLVTSGLSPAQAGEPATVKVTAYVAASDFTVPNGTVLFTATIDVDGGQLVPASLDVDTSTFDDGMAIIEANDPFWAGARIEVLDSNGDGVPNQVVTIDGLEMTVTVTVF